jgi:phenylalanyl-tRNA synthetase beta chain
MKVVHSWLKDYLGESLPPAIELENVFNFHAFEVEGIEEVEGETVIDVDVLPNRSSDCLCHRGVARELSSILNIPLQSDPLSSEPVLATTDKISISIENAEACPRFTAALISDIAVGESPEWLQKRLQALGVRSINNIVDATNYVMYALGEPMHAYDADLFAQVEGKWHFVIRNARAGETISLLAEGGKNEDRIVELTGSELLIVDGATDTPIGLAGVKGGRYAGVHKGTKHIIIEAAHFNPTTTRKTARRLGIVIDASKRFENEPSRALPPYAQAEIIKLITDIAGGAFVGWADEYKEVKSNPEVTVSVAQTNALLGLQLTPEEIKAILKRIGANVVSASATSLTVIGPFERTDLNISEDFIEEVGRIHGLSNIESVVPESKTVAAVNVRQFYTEAIRQQLLEHGFSEVITSSFTNKDTIQLQNALASDKSYLRSTLKKNITKVLDQNFAHCDLLDIPNVRVFEIGTVFDKAETSVSEHVALTIGVRTKGDGYNPKDDAILKNACETVEQVLNTKLVWDMEKGVAETNLSAVVNTLPVPVAYTVFVVNPPATYRPVSAYPAMSRDIALWVQEGELAHVIEMTLAKAAGELCVRLSLFDTFTKDGRTSYAFRLVFQSFERTLTDTEVNTHMDKIYAVAKDKEWEVR